MGGRLYLDDEAERGAEKNPGGSKAAFQAARGPRDASITYLWQQACRSCQDLTWDVSMEGTLNLIALNPRIPAQTFNVEGRDKAQGCFTYQGLADCPPGACILLASTLTGRIQDLIDLSGAWRPRGTTSQPLGSGLATLGTCVEEVGGWSLVARPGRPIADAHYQSWGYVERQLGRHAGGQDFQVGVYLSGRRQPHPTNHLQAAAIARIVDLEETRCAAASGTLKPKLRRSRHSREERRSVASTSIMIKCLGHVQRIGTACGPPASSLASAAMPAWMLVDAFTPAADFIKQPGNFDGATIL
ncbi:hypothetical protein G7046_g7545 [Stylonectria norvegica]|nr:hypothetical protein G7046_g7545 [Stylonectria norvegica]